MSDLGRSFMAPARQASFGIAERERMKSRIAAPEKVSQAAPELAGK
jgi:hypothetical protein